MGFVVHLKDGPGKVTIDADAYEIEDGVYHFSKVVIRVASFPASNVLSVIRESE